MNNDLLKQITPELINNLSPEQRSKVQGILKEYNERKTKYPILKIKLEDYQKEFDEALTAKKEDWTPKYKFIVFLWWNWAWKTLYACYTLIRRALWEKLCRLYKIPPVWNSTLIKVYTSTWDNIRDNLDKKYLLGTGTDTDKLKFPWYLNKDHKGEIIKTTRHDKEVLKEIYLNNGSQITFGTYDQWQHRLQWWEPDFTVMDELPIRYEDFIEILRWTRWIHSQLLISATPTKYNKEIHSYLFNDKMKDVMFLKQIDSFRNPYADRSFTYWLNEEDIMRRRFGSFTPSTWLVYKSFNRVDNIIEHFHPKELWANTRYYAWLDFWQSHPTVCVFCAVDDDWHIYVFDMIYERNILSRDLARSILDIERKYWIKLKHIYADSSAKSERNELKAEWIITIAANKKRKINKTSFVNGWVMKINQLFWLWKLIISDLCYKLIDELLVHCYKDNWEINKINDDACDALRYMISEYDVPSEVRNLKQRRKRIAREAQRYRKY